MRKTEMIASKSKLAVILSQLKKFESPSAIREQYSTESEIAAEVLWYAYMAGDIEGKTVADLGCGTGLLGIGCLLLGARRVYFVDSDAGALQIAQQNTIALELRNAIFLEGDVRSFKRKVSTVVQNPPFGVKLLHADKMFLEKAFEVADTIYSFHKIETRPFIENFVKSNRFRATHFFQFDFSLRATLNFHRKRVHHIMVGCWRIERADKDI